MSNLHSFSPRESVRTVPRVSPIATLSKKRNKPILGAGSDLRPTSRLRQSPPIHIKAKKTPKRVMRTSSAPRSYAPPESIDEESTRDEHSFNELNARKYLIMPKYREVCDRYNSMSVSERNYMAFNTLANITKKYELCSSALSSDEKVRFEAFKQKRSFSGQDIIELQLILRNASRRAFVNKEMESYESQFASVMAVITLGSNLMKSKFGNINAVIKVINRYKSNIMNYCRQYVNDKYEQMNGDVNSRVTLMSVASPIVFIIGGIVIANMLGYSNVPDLILNFINTDEANEPSEKTPQEDEEDEHMF